MANPIPDETNYSGSPRRVVLLVYGFLNVLKAHTGNAYDFSGEVRDDDRGRRSIDRANECKRAAIPVSNESLLFMVASCIERRTDQTAF